MPKFSFSGSVVVEATSEEDALTKIGGRIGAIARHIGNGEPLAKNKPFFTLRKASESDDATDMAADPIRDPIRAAEREAAEKEFAKNMADREAADAKAAKADADAK